MHALQSGMPNAYRNDEIFKKKLLNAIKDVDAYKLVYFKAAATIKGLISDLNSSLALDTIAMNPAALDTYFIDRKFRGQRDVTSLEMIHCA